MKNKLEDKILENVVGGTDTAEYKYVFHVGDWVHASSNSFASVRIEEEVRTNNPSLDVKVSVNDSEGGCSIDPIHYSTEKALMILDKYKRFGGNLSEY